MRKVLADGKDVLYIADDGSLHFADGDGAYGPDDAKPVTHWREINWIFNFSMIQLSEALGTTLDDTPIEEMIAVQLWGYGLFAKSALGWLEEDPSYMHKSTRLQKLLELYPLMLEGYPGSAKILPRVKRLLALLDG